MSRLRHPRRASEAIRAVRAVRAPLTVLAAVQGAWEEAVGPGIAAEAEPVGERDGVVTVACRTATWAQELDLMQTVIVERLNSGLAGAETPFGGDPVKRLRTTAAKARFYT